MKQHLILLLMLILISSCTTKTELFNGTDLDNWTIVVSDSTDGSAVFGVKEGLLTVSGITNAYVRTNEQYSNYKLHLEWRWVEEPTNSGVLLHITGEDMVWPNCIEAQLQAGNAGDFVLIGKGNSMMVNEKEYSIVSEEDRYAVISKFEESSEKESGEWNTYEIIVSDSSIELLVNDVLQNKCTVPAKKSGHIGIQSEGSKMEFRNIYIEK